MLVDSLTRRLAAIVSTDVVGYSRLMGEDEEGTLTTLRGHRADLIDPKICEHHGRIVKTMGDGLLIEFPSVVEAVKCAVELQQGMAARNADIAEASRIEFRIGINLGDILIEDDDIYGDGVNVAARLQELAVPGGICLSRAARDQVRDRMDVRLDDRGEIAVKNIARPVHVFQVLNDSDATQPPADPTHATRKPKRLAATLVVVLALVGGGAAAWMQPWKAAPAFEPRTASAKPSIAVLPFSNLSQDAEQEYFSDGITNDLITDLSKFSELLVIASNSVFTYKGKPVKVQEVGRDLGVRYVLEGSVQKMGERVRINAQLIDARTDQHLWAERYDGGVADLFELQDQITERIVRTLSVRLTNIERERAFKKQTDDLDAYDYVLRGSGLLRRFKRTENFEARQLFRQAVDRDPDYAGAYAGLGNTHLQAVKYGWTGSIKTELKRAEHLARRALAIDDTNVRAHRLLGEIYLFLGRYDLALFELERAIAINPNDAASHSIQGTVLLWSGHPEGAILALETALRYDPILDPSGLANLGLAYYLKARYDDSVRVLERCARRNPDFLYCHLILTAVHGQMGRKDDATRSVLTVRRLAPFFTTDEYGSLFRDPADAARVIDGLRKAGLN